MTLPPFDASDADLTLRTPDGTTFNVYSRILAIASPVFHDMFTLPQPPNAGSPATVDVSETREVMEVLLRLIYPIEDPPIDTLSLLGDTLVAAHKYDMKSACQSLARLLVFPPKSMKEQPIRVYAIACRYGLDEAAKLASSYTLHVNILDATPIEEIKFITGYDYYRLLRLHRGRGAAAQSLVASAASPFKCPACGNPSPKWWTDWSTRAKEELRLRPTTEVIFSQPFLAIEAIEAQKECEICETMLPSAHTVLLVLKEHIDKLPATI